MFLIHTEHFLYAFMSRYLAHWCSSNTNKKHCVIVSNCATRFTV